MFGRLRQDDHHYFEAILGYIVMTERPTRKKSVAIPRHKWGSLGTVGKEGLTGGYRKERGFLRVVGRNGEALWKD